MLSERLKKLRYQKGLNQHQIADCLHISPCTYGLWEQGKREPNAIKLQELAKFFDVTVDYLLGGDSITSTQEKTLKDTILTLEKLTQQLKIILLKE